MPARAGPGVSEVSAPPTARQGLRVFTPSRARDTPTGWALARGYDPPRRSRPRVVDPRPGRGARGRLRNAILQDESIVYVKPTGRVRVDV